MSTRRIVHQGSFSASMSQERKAVVLVSANNEKGFTPEVEPESDCRLIVSEEPAPNIVEHSIATSQGSPRYRDRYSVPRFFYDSCARV